MTHFLVCPNDSRLFRQLAGYAVVPRIDRLRSVRAVVDEVRASGAHLHCLWVEPGLPLSALSFNPDWHDVPLAVSVQSVGDGLADFLAQLPVLRGLNLRLYFSPVAGNLAASRILSSLGIESGIDLRRGCDDWEAVTDLMTYALLGRVAHAPIAPFNYMATRYQVHQRNDYGAVYFDDPRVYLHVDGEMRIALSADELNAGQFIGQGLEALGEIETNAAYVARLERWRDFFLETEGCAFCEGWRVCVGRLASVPGAVPGCRDFAVNFMDTLEMVGEKKPASVSIWQP